MIKTQLSRLPSSYPSHICCTLMYFTVMYTIVNLYIAVKNNKNALQIIFSQCICVVAMQCNAIGWKQRIAIFGGEYRVLQHLPTFARVAHFVCSSQQHLRMSTEWCILLSTTGLRRLQVLCVHVSASPLPSYEASPKLYFVILMYFKRTYN